ncbi:uncharacterized protein LOC124174220 [Ischnura elegans]|uniref:uncharacterized protein LOC124174220 n=1 Tax=Ischnura elegans TaxID=197161 RepID=UPI001ED87C6F|nr:uncharacterized protein LOC124174220 [Ischnura elegans]
MELGKQYHNPEDIRKQNMDLRRYGIATFLLLFMAYTCSGQKYSFGSCPTTLRSVITPAALLLTNIQGVWKEYARSKGTQQHSWRCATYTITQITANIQYSLSIGGRKKVTNSALRVAGTIDIGGSTGGTATAATFLTFNLNDNALLTNKIRAFNYYIIGLDAADPTVLALYACQNVGLGKLESAILLVMSGATDANIVAGLQALAQNGFPSNSLYFQYQADCLVI